MAGVKKGLDVRRAAVGELVENPWNPNRMSPDTLAAETASIVEYGFVDPITVRKHPKRKGKWQIIDGEHRWIAAKNAGLKTVPIVVVELSDASAKKLTLVMNETRGEADRVQLGKVLAELKAEGVDFSALDFSPQEITDLISIADIEWAPDTAEEESKEDGDYHVLTAKIPVAQWPTVEHRLAGIIETVVKKTVAQEIAIGHAIVYALRLTARKGD